MTEMFTPDRRAQNRLEHFEDCATAVDKLFANAQKDNPADAFHNFINFVQQFNNLSVYNSLLVLVQRPGASAVGTRKQWLAIGRRVKPDAIPIVILHPFGPVRFVYELGDTAGQPVPAEGASCLFAEGTVPEILWKRTIQMAERYQIEIALSKQQGMYLAGTAAAFFDYPQREENRSFRVLINANHDLPTQFATLAHELGHIYCGHVGGDAKGQWPNRMRLPVAVKELEAEAVCYLVCLRNGITTRSQTYLNSLMGNVDMSQVSLYTIFDAANRVEARSNIRKRPE